MYVLFITKFIDWITPVVHLVITDFIKDVLKYIHGKIQHVLFVKATCIFTKTYF